MAKSGEFYTFDEVVRQLKIDESKLKRLVSEGEISAFREGDVMKFKKTEIDKLATKGPGSETSETVLSEITLEDEAPAFEESGETLTDDLVFESSEPDQVDLGSDAGMATEEISSQDTFIEDTGDDVGMTTEPIDLSADLTQEVEEEEEIEEIESPVQRRSAPAARRRAVEAPAGSPGMTFCLVLSAILIALGLAVGMKAGSNEVDPVTHAAKPLGATFRKLSNMFYDSFGTKKVVVDEINKTRGGLPAVTATETTEPAGG